MDFFILTPPLLIDGKNKGFLSASQRQDVIKLLEKKS